MSFGDYRWEYSPLATAGDSLWKYVIGPTLKFFASDQLSAWNRIRCAIQFIVAFALIALAGSLIWNPGRMLTASGLLFDMAGALRLFMLEEVTEAIEPFKKKKHLPSVMMREVIMPEASGPYFEDEPDGINEYYYKRRGIMFLFVGFVLQMIGDFL